MSKVWNFSGPLTGGKGGGRGEGGHGGLGGGCEGELVPVLLATTCGRGRDGRRAEGESFREDVNEGELVPVLLATTCGRRCGSSVRVRV